MMLEGDSVKTISRRHMSTINNSRMHMIGNLDEEKEHLTLGLPHSKSSIKLK